MEKVQHPSKEDQYPQGLVEKGPSSVQRRAVSTGIGGKRSIIRPMKTSIHRDWWKKVHHPSNEGQYPQGMAKKCPSSVQRRPVSTGIGGKMSIIRPKKGSIHRDWW
ncbi:hypothetical protein HPT25_05225 [Bacillus sp. BRMEA1]|nr:hypothetical protein [Neobacillus endophyticus]